MNGVKKCPRCKIQLPADIQQCISCNYDFTNHDTENTEDELSRTINKQPPRESIPDNDGTSSSPNFEANGTSQPFDDSGGNKTSEQKENNASSKRRQDSGRKTVKRKKPVHPKKPKVSEPIIDSIPTIEPIVVDSRDLNGLRNNAGTSGSFGSILREIFVYRIETQNIKIEQSRVAAELERVRAQSRAIDHAIEAKLKLQLKDIENRKMLISEGLNHIKTISMNRKYSRDEISNGLKNLHKEIMELINKIDNNTLSAHVQLLKILSEERQAWSKLVVESTSQDVESVKQVSDMICHAITTVTHQLGFSEHKLITDEK